MTYWTESDREALQEVARAAREAAASQRTGALAGTLLEAVADVLTVRGPMRPAASPDHPSARA
jgi:hypothetical protein